MGKCRAVVILNEEDESLPFFVGGYPFFVFYAVSAMFLKILNFKFCTIPENIL